MKSFNTITLILSGSLLVLQFGLFGLICWGAHITDVRCQQSEEAIHQEGRRIVEEMQEERKKTEQAVSKVNREFLYAVEKQNRQLLRDFDKSLNSQR